MNAKTSKLIRKFCNASKVPYRLTKQEYLKLPRNGRHNLKQTMRESL
jgi:hypothetical protein